MVTVQLTNVKIDNLVLNRFSLLFILALISFISNGQGSYNYSRFGVGLYASYNRPYADLKKANDGKTIALAGYYNLSPYIPLGLEVQAGGLSGGDINTDRDKRQYDNHYKAVLLRGDFGLGEILNYDQSSFMRVIKDFYVGTGVGVISNKMAFVQRTNLTDTSQEPKGSYTFPGQSSSLNLIVPLRVGYEFKIYDNYDEPFMGINIGYIHNITWGEGLDGYADPRTGFKNNSPDQYRQIVVGVKFNFGSTVPFIKSIN
jgi:hypothetical protein